MERRKNKKDRRKTVRELFEEHAKDDKANFEKINTSLQKIDAYMERGDEHIREDKVFKESLAWLSDISRGTQLLKRPSLWLVAFVVGIVALSGGLKALALGALSIITPK
jgi:hypothetical protein